MLRRPIDGNGHFVGGGTRGTLDRPEEQEKAAMRSINKAIVGCNILIASYDSNLSLASSSKFSSYSSSSIASSSLWILMSSFFIASSSALKIISSTAALASSSINLC
ncbi:hypothetical protein NQ318_018921 [Aromia moschata]|uniref:Uncharacterized protein n=1 Tax=Aromia moschata TaxID=1265417 RepID=A0AAV8ZI72_9CUCU|nr:hypothetical protein NQ318_018921 [Aromia moschata]